MCILAENKELAGIGFGYLFWNPKHEFWWQIAQRQQFTDCGYGVAFNGSYMTTLSAVCQEPKIPHAVAS